MNNPALPNGLDLEAPVPALLAQERPTKKFPRKIPRNPLISLNSDEKSKEIQGNPNLINRGFRSQMGRPQENPN